MGWATTAKLLPLIVLTSVVAPVRAQDADLIRTINGKQYVLKDYSYRNAQGASFLARIFVPEDHDPSRSYELVMFLHGAGEVGSDNTSQVNVNIDNLIAQAEDRDFLLYIPQASGTFWGDDRLTIAEAAFARAVREYHVDPNRIYATGLSMGGVGVQKLMTNWNETYAAFVPLSVANSSSLDADKAADVAAWYFNGRQDATFINGSRIAYRNLVRVQGGADPVYPPTTDTVNDFHHQFGSVRYTEYAKGGHNNVVWNNGAYATDAMYDWLFAHTSSFGALQQGQTVAINFVGSEFATTIDASGTVWNTLGQGGAQRTQDYALGFADNTAGERTTVSVAVTKPFDNASTTSTAGITALADPAAAGKFWRTFAGESASLLFDGLEPGRAYRIDLFASIDSAADHTGLYAAGDRSAILNASFNHDQFAVLDGIVADNDGQILLTITPTAGANRAIVNAIFITAIPEPAACATLLSCVILLRRQPTYSRFGGLVR